MNDRILDKIITMLESDKVQSSEQGKARLRQVLREANLTQEELSQRSNVSLDTIKRLLGTKACPNGVERWAVRNIVKILNINPTEIVDHKNWYLQQKLPSEFEALIKEKTRKFCGREFVFIELEKFLNDHPNGYFTVVGDAGMGKSSIAAKYVSDHQAICYFNILAERRNRPEQFLESIRQQLINLYQLQDAQKTDLPTLLAKVSQKLSSGEHLVIVVDALDEVEQEPGAENLLYLPETLPEKVYFFLTRRPYNLAKKRLKLSPETPVKELDLTANEYVEFSREDVRKYINLFLNEDLEYKDALKKWIQERNIAPEEFVEQVVAKSENNFMYLRYILPAIANRVYDYQTLNELPQGLQEYYQIHWVRMGMDAVTQELMVIILFIVVEIGTPIPCEMIAAITQEDEYKVQSVLDKWVGYLRRQKLQGEICYSIYHSSFLDFLKAKWELKSTRKLFIEVNQWIVNYLEREMM